MTGKWIASSLRSGDDDLNTPSQFTGGVC